MGCDHCISEVTEEETGKRIQNCTVNTVNYTRNHLGHCLQDVKIYLEILKEM